MARPAKDQLEHLYLSKHLSTRAIADIHGVSHTSVKRWLRLYDIPRRPDNNGLTYRGEEAPSAEELRRMIHVEHLSYREIAKRFNIVHSAVTHWIERYGIEKPTVWATRRKGVKLELPSADELHRLYVVEGLSSTVIAQQCGAGTTTISRLLRSYNIETRKEGWRKGMRYTCQDGHSVRSMYEQLVDNWLHAHNVAHDYEPPIPNDRRRKADFLANGWYIEVWGVTNSAIYERRKSAKQHFYKQHNVPLIEIPATAFDQMQTWERELQACLTPPK